MKMKRHNGPHNEAENRFASSLENSAFIGRCLPHCFVDAWIAANFYLSIPVASHWPRQRHRVVAAAYLHRDFRQLQARLARLEGENIYQQRPHAPPTTDHVANREGRACH
jgi:hypothetical protein